MKREEEVEVLPEGDDSWLGRGQGLEAVRVLNQSLKDPSHVDAAQEALEGCHHSARGKRLVHLT